MGRQRLLKLGTAKNKRKLGQILYSLNGNVEGYMGCELLVSTAMNLSWKIHSYRFPRTRWRLRGESAFKTWPCLSSHDGITITAE